MKREYLAAAAVIFVVVGAVGVQAALYPPSSEGSVSFTSGGAVYQVVKENLTLTGAAASVPCEGMNLASCPANATLAGVQLIQYGGSYFYLASQAEASGAPMEVNGVTASPSTTYAVWFTNSSVFCISPAHPLTNTFRQNPTCPTVPYHRVTITVPVPAADAENATLGLRLGLALAANPGGTLNVTVSDFNVGGTVDNLTAASSWPLAGVEMFLWAGGQSCGVPPDVPVGYAIFQGSYTLAELQGEQPLTTYAYPLVECPYEASTPYYAFAPHSDVAQGYTLGNIPSLAGKANITVDTACPWAPGNGCVWSLIGPQWGYWTGTSTQSGAGLGVDGGFCPTAPGQQRTLDCPLTFNPFPPGTYTVLAGDEWGQAVALQFTVQWG